MSTASMKTFILPMAGFGKRTGFNKSKELLFYKGERRPIMYHSLEIAEKYGYEPVVITRKDKEDLNKELKKLSDIKQFTHVVLDETEEWSHSVLQSQEHWKKKNILVLPDTRFLPESIIEQIDKELDKYDLVFAVFDVADLSKWGVVGIVDNLYFVVEKPTNLKVKIAHAWGLIGFKDTAGSELFEKIYDSGKDHETRKLLNQNVKIIRLNDFKDIGRSPKDLKETRF